MNERIRELAIEAKLMVSTYTGELTKSEQKFAELIVRECATMTRNLSPHGKLAENAVKEHFGVEE